MFNFFLKDLLFFSFHSRIMYWIKNINVLETFALQSFWYVSDTNWTARKYLNLLNYNELIFYCCKFRSIYGYNYERYRKKNCVFLKYPASRFMQSPQFASKIVINNFRGYFKMAIQRASRIFSTLLPFTSVAMLGQWTKSQK